MYTKVIIISIPFIFVVIRLCCFKPTQANLKEDLTADLKGMFDWDSGRLIKNYSTCIGIAVLLWDDLLSGDLAAGKDRSEREMDGRFTSLTKNGENLSFWTDVFWWFSPIPFLVGFVYLTYKQKTAVRIGTVEEE